MSTGAGIAIGALFIAGSWIINTGDPWGGALIGLALVGWAIHVLGEKHK